MSVPGLAPPPFFLATPGRPPLPWEQWEQLSNVYLVASGAAEFTPARRKAILLHCLGPEGQRIYQTLPAGSTAATQPVPSAAALVVKDGDKSAAATSDEYETALVALRHHFSTSCNVVVERHRFHRRQHSGDRPHCVGLKHKWRCLMTSASEGNSLQRRNPSSLVCVKLEATALLLANNAAEAQNGNEIFECYMFRSRTRAKGEPFKQFYRDLQLKSKSCNFENLRVDAALPNGVRHI
ncbi:hypothetical protein HPB52_004387 [Rhipicephalus sanguineus]|uniref:Uncharacterized protein n=1 Tax=Rhipicephalus sanguineus TaxID=34632 RepID=A0A9D4T3T6_RHISA|nr:hypothetical protein HPB52_004387 [Rhipicephalus sanguineus]